jgi:hypothetical protein
MPNHQNLQKTRGTSGSLDKENPENAIAKRVSDQKQMNLKACQALVQVGSRSSSSHTGSIGSHNEAPLLV